MFPLFICFIGDCADHEVGAPGADDRCIPRSRGTHFHLASLSFVLQFQHFFDCYVQNNVFYVVFVFCKFRLSGSALDGVLRCVETLPQFPNVFVLDDVISNLLDINQLEEYFHFFLRSKNVWSNVHENKRILFNLV